MSDTSSMKGNWRTSKMVGLSVYNDNNESLGSINDLLADKNGDIKAMVLGVGGFLGVGEHLVVVPFDKVKFADEPVAYTGTAGAPNAAGARPSTSTTDGRRHDRACGRCQEKSVVPGSRRVQCDQGSAEGDARVQIFDRVTHRSQGNPRWPDGMIAARPFRFKLRPNKHGAAHPIRARLTMLALCRGRSVLRPA